MQEQQEKDNSLDFLKKLEEYSFESKMLIAQCYSCRIMGPSGISIESCLKNDNILSPSEIEIFTVYSIVFDSDGAKKQITDSEFCEFITSIRNYMPIKNQLEHEKTKVAEYLFMLLALQQISVEGPILVKLFRYSYFFHFSNDSVNVQNKFIDQFGCDYSEYAVFAYILYLYMGLDTQNEFGVEKCKNIVECAMQNRTVLNNLKITKENYVKELSLFYDGNINDYFYGLKLQYLYPLIESLNFVYIPQPYLIVNAVTDSFLNRLTEGDDQLRSLIGKEVIETYLYEIYSEVSSVSWITSEISYGKGKLSPDIIAVEDAKCVFIDTKAKTPRLSLRKLDRRSIENDIYKYAENLVQLYMRVTDYLNGEYLLEGGSFSREEIFAVSVVLEDSYIPRTEVYEKAFEIIEKENPLSSDDKVFIHGRIKILPLRAIEEYIIRGRGLVPFLNKQLSNPDTWDDYQFLEEFETTNYIHSFNVFYNDLIEKAKETTTKKFG